MRVNDPNLRRGRQLAGALGELCERIVFVGGAVAGLLADPLAENVRVNRDVDAVVNASRTTFHRIEADEAAHGFARDVHSEVLGFSNRWYPYAVETVVSVDLGQGVVIRLVSAVAFVATKLEVFASRRGGDFLTSHDLEDVLNIVDGREELVGEMRKAPRFTGGGGCGDGPAAGKC